MKPATFQLLHKMINIEPGLISERADCWVPFPCVPDNLRAKYSINGLFLRPFGVFKRDIEIDFKQKARPYPVTEILQCCTRDKNGKTPKQNFFWDLTAGKRIECLLTIVMSGYSSKLSIHLCCLNDNCRQPMEVEISQEEIADFQLQNDKADSFMIQIGDKGHLIRKPTGRDQIEWLNTSFANEDAAMKGMLRTLLHGDDKTSSDIRYPMSDERVKTLNKSMDELDPLVNFDLRAYCPYCDKENRYEINLEELSLYKLQEAQKGLLQTIHRLALHYHWREEDVFSIPPWRRYHYLDLIEKEETL